MKGNMVSIALKGTKVLHAKEKKKKAEEALYL